MVARASRDELAKAMGAVLFSKLQVTDVSKLFEAVGASADWGAVAQYTRQAIRSTHAAATLSTLYVKNLAVLDGVLEPQMFLAGDRLSTADLVCHVALSAVFASFDDEHKWALCNVSRWFDMVQHMVLELEPPSALGCDLIPFNYEAPEILPVVSSLRPLVGAAGPTGADGAAAAVPAPPPTASAPVDAPTEKAQKKEKKEKPKKEKPTAPPVAAEAGQSDISKLDIRVGLIISVECHPDAEKLFVEKVDVGEEAPRTVVSGLVEYMPAEALLNRRAVLLCNLKPANMRGVTSQAMVLAASKEDGESRTVELLSPPDGVPVGERVLFEGHPGEPLAPNVIAKKKVFEAVAPLLATNQDRVAVYDGVPFMTTGGPCTVATLAGGNIK
eukprot:CAMPEP_0183332306 /NCGR_PEP_ID=MMETSP0164_2-20130417/1524_1 /TAXON_ID=221442 /ORGANISM="Coccolithus pelagicus ssp braarudi, Strain PLY182g" /LENGTH=385 /DNA_ID=CAMNT_0025501009 /DNA_START=22 /DNA_END=1179 /DNA_ORIENTATION=+